MKKNSKFDTLFPGVARDVELAARRLIDADSPPEGVALAMIIAGAELVAALEGAPAAVGALRDLAAEIETGAAALEGRNSGRIAAIA